MRPLILLCAALLVACSNPAEVENPEQTIIVIGYLTPGLDTEITLRQTLPPEIYYDGLEDTLLSAEVSIRTGGETFVLSPDAADPGLFRLAHETMPIAEGQTYELLVEQGGRQARAQTTVPFKAEVTEVSTHAGDGETIVYNQAFGDLFGNLVHPGEFFWSRSDNAAGYVIIVEATEVRSLPPGATAPLTGDLDRLIELRTELLDQVAPDSLVVLGGEFDTLYTFEDSLKALQAYSDSDAVLDGEVETLQAAVDSLMVLDGEVKVLRAFFAENLALVDGQGEPIRWLRERQQLDWEEIDEQEKWSEGKKWREKLDDLFFARKLDYWIPADSTRSDFWWLGVRFEGEYRVRLQAADLNYFDYFTTSFNGQSGSDGDKGPVFHVEGGTGVFGSYVEDSFRILAYRDDRVGGGKMVVEVVGDD